jgi:hypothetical protein
MALGLLVHAGATGFAERVLFRGLAPRALRSWRLAMTRLALLAAFAALYFCESSGIRLSTPIFVWALTGAAGTALTAVLAWRLIATIRAFRAWRHRKGQPAPAHAEAAQALV